jgi:hypothetical protein
LKTSVCRASSKARHYQGNARWKSRFLTGARIRQGSR